MPIEYYQNESARLPSYPVSILKAVVYSHATTQMANRFCKSMEDREKCMDGHWLMRAQDPFDDMAKATGQLVERCNLEPVNVTLPGRVLYFTVNLLLYIDQRADLLLDKALLERIKLGEEIDTCEKAKEMVDHVATAVVSNGF